MTFDHFLPEPFYRVATRALIFDDQARLLVVENNDHQYELPGGGWDHNEDFVTCTKREVFEELGAEVATVGPIVLTYKARDMRNFMSLRLCSVVTLAADPQGSGTDMVSARYAGKDELRSLTICPGEGLTDDLIDQIYALA